MQPGGNDVDIAKVARFAVMAASGATEKPTIAPLAGDASTRRYFRVTFHDGQEMVVMAAANTHEIDSFKSMTMLMAELGADVPKLLVSDEELLAMEDLGDAMLQNSLVFMVEDEKEEEYRRTIDNLVRFQAASVAHQDRSHECFSRRFDEEKLGYEIDFANQYFLKSYLGIELDWSVMAVLELEWEKLIAELASDMETLAHRDFHSRNIMVAGERRVWIDYQDARLGRMQYDLVSLLLDPYVELGPGTEERLADYYYDQVCAAGVAPWSRERFDELYSLSAAQRLYKALGTYGYQATMKNSQVYTPYIGPAVRRLMRVVLGSERLSRLGSVLEQYLGNY